LLPPIAWEFGRMIGWRSSRTTRATGRRRRT
jgi:hypothetical protein